MTLTDGCWTHCNLPPPRPQTRTHTGGWRNMVRLTLIEAIRVNSDDRLTVELQFREISSEVWNLGRWECTFLCEHLVFGLMERGLPGSPGKCQGPRGSLRSLKRLSNRETRNKFGADHA